MIYYDNAATTYPKPEAVTEAVCLGLRQGASVGRSSHPPARYAAEQVFACRAALREMFSAPSEECVVFTHNATDALNLAVKGMMQHCRKAAISPYEHNSVLRPVHKTASLREIPYTVMQSRLFCDEDILEQTERLAKDGTDLFVVTCVSNVFGYILPVLEMDEIIARHGGKLILDASQSAGSVPLCMKAFRSLAAVCMPGHKGLYGPQGTGVLLLNGDGGFDTLLEGGTGSRSAEVEQPEFLPDRFESGTHNFHGIAGLRAGVELVGKITPPVLLEHGRKLGAYLADGLEVMGERVFRPKHTVGTVAFVPRSRDCETVCEILAQHGVCARGGLHCAPLAHKAAGTFGTGAVRLSFGMFNTPAEGEEFLKLYQKIILC